MTDRAAPAEPHDSAADGESMDENLEQPHAGRIVNTITTDGTAPAPQAAQGDGLVQRLDDAGDPRRGARDHKLIREAAAALRAKDEQLAELYQDNVPRRMLLEAQAARDEAVRLQEQAVALLRAVDVCGTRSKVIDGMVTRFLAKASDVDGDNLGPHELLRRSQLSNRELAAALRAKDATVLELRDRVSDKNSQISGLGARLTTAEARIAELERAPAATPAERLTGAEVEQLLADGVVAHTGRRDEQDALYQSLYDAANHKTMRDRLAEAERLLRGLTMAVENNSGAEPSASVLDRARVQAWKFLASAKASDGEACSVCGGTMFPGHKHP